MSSNNIIHNALFDYIDFTKDDGFNPDDNIQEYIQQNHLKFQDFANNPREYEKVSQAEKYMINECINEWKNKISQEDKDYLSFPEYTSYYMWPIKSIERLGIDSFYRDNRQQLFKYRLEEQGERLDSGENPNLLDDNKREQHGNKFDKLFDAVFKYKHAQQIKNQEQISPVKGNEFPINKKNIAKTRNYKVKDPLYELLNNKDKFKLVYAFVKQKREQQRKKQEQIDAIKENKQQIKNKEQINTTKENEQQIENKEQVSTVKGNEQQIENKEQVSTVKGNEQQIKKQEQINTIKKNKFTIHKKNTANKRSRKVKKPLYKLLNNEKFFTTILNKYLEYKQQQKQGIKTNNNKNFHPKVKTKNILNRVENDGKYKQFCQNSYR